MWRLMPWFATLVAGVLAFTPTYGLGLTISPMTLLGSASALSRDRRESQTLRVAAVLNLVIVLTGLTLTIAVWGLNFWSVTGFALFVVVVAFAITDLQRRRRVRDDGSS